MAQTNKTANRSFLDKFEGRANKVPKSGIQAVLTAPKERGSQKKTVNNQQEHAYEFRKVDLDVLIPTNPEKQSKQNTDSIVKRRDSLNKPPSKSTSTNDYVPSAYTPQSSSKEETLASNHPPSRSLSNSTGSSRGKYIFGKYLKLDKQALSHIEFLHSIEEKSFFKKGRGESLNMI